MNTGPIHGPKWEGSAKHFAEQCPAHIFCGQEVNNLVAAGFDRAGWLRTPDEYLGLLRTDFTPQLMIAAWPSLATSVTVVPSHSRTVPLGTSAGGATHWLTAHVGWKWLMAGQDGVTVTSMHLHRNMVAKEGSPKLAGMFDQLAKDLRSGGVRVLAGDANKALFYLATVLEEEHGLQLDLVARAAGFNINEPLPALNDRLLREAILHDSCGI